MISVLIPVRNASPWIEEAVRSVANQTIPPGEILVADDASTDGTAEILEGLDIPSLRVLRTDSNRGISWQLNRLVSVAKGRWLARMDGDDVSEPERFATQIPLMEKRGLAVCGSWSRRFGKADTLHRFAAEDPAIKCGLLFSVPFCHPSVVFDRERLGDRLRYDPEFDVAEDYHLWIRLRTAGPFGNAQRVLLRWRMHGTNAGTATDSSSIQKTRASKVRDILLSEYGLHLSSSAREALEKRSQAVVLDGPGNDRFLEALLQVSRLPEETLQSPRGIVGRVLGEHWDLSCLLSAWTVPGTARLWWRGHRALGAPASAEVAAKVVLKSLVGRIRGRQA